jgi:hypothetical protein
MRQAINIEKIKQFVKFKPILDLPPQALGIIFSEMHDK